MKVTRKVHKDRKKIPRNEKKIVKTSKKHSYETKDDGRLKLLTKRKLDKSWKFSKFYQISDK